MSTRDSILFLLACLLLGPLADFFCNGVVIGYVLHAKFTDKYSFVYIPFFVTVAMVLSNLILHSRFVHLHSRAVIAFFVGAIVSHLTLVGFKYNRGYSMDLDVQYDAGKQTFLLRSAEWSQILFVQSARAQEELKKNYQHRPVPVQVAVVSDYGCDRSAVVSTVAGVDVRDDAGASWTWQVDRSTGLPAGPGDEDKRLFWCWHPDVVKYLENPPARAWEVHSTQQSTPR